MSRSSHFPQDWRPLQHPLFTLALPSATGWSSPGTGCICSCDLTEEPSPCLPTLSVNPCCLLLQVTAVGQLSEWYPPMKTIRGYFRSVIQLDAFCPPPPMFLCFLSATAENDWDWSRKYTCLPLASQVQCGGSIFVVAKQSFFGLRPL